MEPERRPLQVDIGKLDLHAARTEALRLIASSEADVDVLLIEAARVMTELLDGIDLDAVDDEELSTLAHRILEIVAGLTIVGDRAVSDLAEERNVERVEILQRIETEIEADMREDED